MSNIRRASWLKENKMAVSAQEGEDDKGYGYKDFSNGRAPCPCPLLSHVFTILHILYSVFHMSSLNFHYYNYVFHSNMLWKLTVFISC